MQLKTFLIAASAATAMAQVDSALNPLATLNFGIPPADLSVFSVLATAIPSSLQSAITDPAVQASLASALSAGNAPAWYSDMPAEVKSYINTVGGDTSNMPLSSVASSLTAAVTSVRSSTSALPLQAASSSATRASSSSTGGAPAPTAAIVGSMASVVGVLALAIGL